MRRNKSKKLIKELIKRRDEVIKRAVMIANKKIPEYLLVVQLADLIEWIIKPHIREQYSDYKKPVDKEVRGFQRLLQKITMKGEKYEKTN